MEYLSELLPIIIYILLIVLIILLIIICVKSIKALNKVQEIVDNVDKKVRTFDGIFEIMDVATDKIANLSDRIINILTGVFEKVFRVKDKKNKKLEKEKEEDE